MKRFCLLWLLVPCWVSAQVNWSQTFSNSFPPWNGYHDIAYDDFSKALYVYSTNITSDSSQMFIYSSRLHYYLASEGYATDHQIANNGQLGDAGCFNSQDAGNNFPPTQHPVGQFFLDKIRHRLWLMTGVCGTVRRTEWWYYQLTNPPDNHTNWVKVTAGPTGTPISHFPMNPTQDYHLVSTLAQDLTVGSTTMVVTNPAQNVNFSTGANNDILYSTQSGAAGTVITIQHVNPVASDATLSITVNTSTLSGITHKDIKVNLAKSAGTLTSTANSVIAAVNADATAGPLIQGSLCTNVAAACDATNDGTGLVTAPGVSVQSQGFANGDTIKLSTGELVIVTAGGGRHGTNGPVAGTSLTVQRNAWGTTPASGTVTSGTSVATQVGLFDNATIAHDTDHDAFLLVGYDNGSDTHSMQVYCNTENNPTPGTLTAAQQSVGCTLPDDFNDITSKARGGDLAITGGASLPRGVYYPEIGYDVVRHQVVKFAGLYGQNRIMNQLWTYDPVLRLTAGGTASTSGFIWWTPQIPIPASDTYVAVNFNGGSPTFDGSLGDNFQTTLTGNLVSWTNINLVAGHTYTFRLCQGGTGLNSITRPANMVMLGADTFPRYGGGSISQCMQDSFSYNGTTLTELAPGNSSEGNENGRVAFAMGSNGKYYYHKTAHAVPTVNGGVPIFSSEDWVYDPAVNTWTQLPQTTPGAQFTETLAWDSTLNKLVSYAANVNVSGAYTADGIATVWSGGQAGTTPPSITTCGSGSGSTCPAGVLNAVYSQQLNATGSVPITWTCCVSGSLPAGLTLSSAGVLSGVPTATGISTFTVTAANGASPNATKQFTLQVNGPGTFSQTLTVQEALYPGGSTGVARTNETFCQGLPLPDSAGISNLSVLGLNGATAGQFRVLGTWPGGNLKWIEVCGIVASLSASGTATVTLTNGGVGNFGGGNLATQSGNITINNTGGATACGSSGATCWTIPGAAGYNVFDTVTVGTTTVVASGSSQGLVVMGPPPSATYPAKVTCSPTSGGVPCTTVYASKNTSSASSCAVEKNGPVEAVIKCTGDLADSAGNVYMHYTTRSYFYQGKNSVRVQTVLRNADYGTSNTFATAFKGHQGNDLRLALVNTGTATESYMFGVDSTHCTAGICTGTETGTDSVYLYQGKSSALAATNGSGAAIQYTNDTGYTLVKNAAAIFGPTANSLSPQGWADISDSNGVGVTVGVYQLSAYYPKSLEFNAGGTDVRIGLWASENGAPTSGPGNGTKPYYIPWPQHQTTDVYLNFHTSAPTGTAAANGFLSFQQYLLAFATPSYYNSTAAVPYTLVSPAVEDSFYTTTQAAATVPTPAGSCTIASVSRTIPVTLGLTGCSTFAGALVPGQAVVVSGATGSGCTDLPANGSVCTGGMQCLNNPTGHVVQSVNGNNVAIIPMPGTAAGGVVFNPSTCSYTANSGTMTAQATIPSTAASCQESSCDYGVLTAKWPLQAFTVNTGYGWPAGGGSNQSDFRLGYLLNAIERQWFGRWLTAAHFYRFVSDYAFAWSDGFTWRSKGHCTASTPELDCSGFPTAASANSTLATRNASWLDGGNAQEHAHAYGLMLYYYLSGDESIKDGLLEGVKDYALNADTYQAGQYLGFSAFVSVTNNSAAVGFNSGTNFVNEITLGPCVLGGTLVNFASVTDGTHAVLSSAWAGPSGTFQRLSCWGGLGDTRMVGINLKWYGLFAQFLGDQGDPDQATALQIGEQNYAIQVAGSLCASGYPVGCNAGPAIGGPWQSEGISRTRGLHYGSVWVSANPWCQDNSKSFRGAAAFQHNNLIGGIRHLRDAAGPSWNEYLNSLDLMYGLSRWSLNEMYIDDGGGRWDKNGFRYYLAIDEPGNCSNFTNMYDYHEQAQAQQTVAMDFWPTYIVEGNSSWKQKFQMNWQKDMSVLGLANSSPASDFYSYEPEEIMSVLNAPTGLRLRDVPITGVTENGGGSGNYTIQWTVPAGVPTCAAATSLFCGYRIKWGSKAIVDWLGFDPISNTFTVDPVNNMPWFAASNVPSLPNPGTAGTTQSLTFQTSPVRSGLTAANVSVKAYEPSGNLTIVAQSLPATTVGATYNWNIAGWASGGTPPYSFTIATGSLPAGLSLSPVGGMISGTVTAPAGGYSFMVGVSDSLSGAATSGWASINVNAAPGVSTASPLPGGTQGTAYGQTLAATGGTAPLIWDVSAGSLPAGLVLSPGGAISGSPTQSGTFNFTARVTDASSVSATRAFAITIAAPASTTVLSISGSVSVTGKANLK